MTEAKEAGMSTKGRYRVTQDGQYTTFEGGKYDGDRSPTETAKLIRKDIAQAVKTGVLPRLKYRVVKAHGWGSFNVSVNVPDVNDWAFNGRRDEDGSGRDEWSPQAMLVGYMLHEIAEAYVRHTSDIMTDYWSGGYVHVYVSEDSAHGGLCLSRFSEREVAPKWEVRKSPMGWAVYCTSISTVNDYEVFPSFASAVAEADYRARAQLSAGDGGAGPMTRYRGRYAVNEPDRSGAWVRDGRFGGKPLHRHVASGAVIRYRCNDWVWEIVGGANDGLRVKALWYAQELATGEAVMAGWTPS